MARYIDADKLIEHIKDLPTWLKEEGWWHSIHYPDGHYDCEDVINSIENAPAADVEEVKHGEWELKSEIRRFLEEVDEDFYVECPFCHRVYYVPFEFEDEKMLEYAKKNYPYCNCGAKMDGRKDE